MFVYNEFSRNILFFTGLEKPLSVLINELVGPWTFKYKDGFEGHVTVSTTGKIQLKGREDWEVYLQPSNNQKVFQSIKGWIMVKKTFRGEDSWDYYRLTKNGTVEIQAFWKKGCSLHYRGKVDNYCFSGLGFRGKFYKVWVYNNCRLLLKDEKI